MSDKLFYYFDNYRLDAHTRVLYRGDDVVRLEPKIVDMLLMLVQRQGMVVSKEDLMKKIWAIPSPDGNYLMLHKVARKSNLWLLQR